jgi:hypothetical protein
MSKNYQKKTAPAVTAAEVAVPERVTIAMTELAGAVEEGLLALAVATGMQVMHTIMDADVTGACGPKGCHDPARSAVRHGTEAGSVTQPTLAVIDGSKALRRAILDVFDHAVIARCQLHKLRNVKAKLPDALGAIVATKMRAAYRDPDALAAEAALEALARQLDKAHLNRRLVCEVPVEAG